MRCLNMTTIIAYFLYKRTISYIVFFIVTNAWGIPRKSLKLRKLYLSINMVNKYGVHRNYIDTYISRNCRRMSVFRKHTIRIMSVNRLNDFKYANGCTV